MLTPLGTGIPGILSGCIILLLRRSSGSGFSNGGLKATPAFTGLQRGRGSGSGSGSGSGFVNGGLKATPAFSVVGPWARLHEKSEEQGLARLLLTDLVWIVAFTTVIVGVRTPFVITFGILFKLLEAVCTAGAAQRARDLYSL